VASLIKRIAQHSGLVGGVIASCNKALGSTLRFDLVDQSGFLDGGSSGAPVIWLAWHNRVLFLPELYRTELPERPTVVLTSASRDGEMIAAVMARYGMGAVRGSSSRKGREALLAAVRLVRSGSDLAIVPDGPRGPRYRMQPGAIKLAQLTGAPILPIGMRPRASWRLEKSWDRLHIPRPFSRVAVTLAPLQRIDRKADVAAECTRIEQLMIEINGGED
jgi:lysophospholipid acyltransferase (LPLAT)-like uncharacterized protein